MPQIGSSWGLWGVPRGRSRAKGSQRGPELAQEGPIWPEASPKSSSLAPLGAPKGPERGSKIAPTGAPSAACSQDLIRRRFYSRSEPSRDPSGRAKSFKNHLLLQCFLEIAGVGFGSNVEPSLGPFSSPLGGQNRARTAQKSAQMAQQVGRRPESAEDASNRVCQDVRNHRKSTELKEVRGQDRSIGPPMC